MCLVTIATADANAATYHGSRGLRIIAMKSPERMAPSGISHLPFFIKRIGASISAAAITALAITGATSRKPEAVAASTAIAERMMMRSKFPVRELC